MSVGRPPGRPLDPDQPGPVAQEVAEIDARGRLRFSSRLISPITWAGNSEETVDALMVFEEPGRIVLLSWKESASVVLARRRELIEEAKTNTAALETLRLLEDRYHRLQMPKDHRPILSAEALFHLHIIRGEKSYVYVERVFDRIEIISSQYRNERAAGGIHEFEALP